MLVFAELWARAAPHQMRLRIAKQYTSLTNSITVTIVRSQKRKINKAIRFYIYRVIARFSNGIVTFRSPFPTIFNNLSKYL